MSADGISEATLFFATAAGGTEQVLAAELGELDAGPVFPGPGGVAFGSRLEHAYRVCLWSRVASRVLMPLVRFHAETAEVYYEAVHGVSWTDHLGPEHTMAVSVAGSNSPVGPSHFLALKTKDAIVDQVREKTGSRPNVDKQQPDVRIHVFVSPAGATVSLDLAGQPLHRRGLA